eukprot:6587_1
MTMTPPIYVFTALVLSIYISKSFAESSESYALESFESATIRTCTAIDVLRYNDIAQRYRDLEGLASKGRLNGQNPDPVAISNYIDFLEETLASDFRFEFFYVDRNIAPEAIPFVPNVPNPFIYTNRNTYLYGDQKLGILPWLATIDLFFGTENLNGGQFGYVNCDSETNTATLVSRTVDLLSGGRGEFDVIGNPLGNVDVNNNGRIDNVIGIGRSEATFNGYMITALKVEVELYATVEYNSFQDQDFPTAKKNTATKEIVKSGIFDEIGTNYHMSDIIGNSILNTYLLIIMLILVIANWIMSYKTVCTSKEMRCDDSLPTEKKMFLNA